MYKIAKQNAIVENISVYLEIYGSNQISYRVLNGILINKSSKSIIYGVEIENVHNMQKESILDFSSNVDEAVDFVESLIKNKKTPDELYNHALSFLSYSL